MAALLAGAPAAASVPEAKGDDAKAYVAARAASIRGDHGGAAELYARLAATSPDADLRERAISEAINAGQMELALRLLRQRPQADLTIHSRLLLVADALKRGKPAEASSLLTGSGGPDLGFWVPLVEAWAAAERKNLAEASAVLAKVPRNSAFGPYVDEQQALILLKLGKTAEAEPFARRAIGKAGPREYRLRLALAAGFAAAGDAERARAMLDGMATDSASAWASIEGKSGRSLIIDTVEEAFSEQLMALALEMRRARNGRGSPVHIAQIARFAAPANSSAAILLGAFLGDQERIEEALAVLRSIDAGDPLKPEAIDAEARALIDSRKFDAALQLARAAAGRPQASADDYARLGDVYGEMKRHNEAAEWYGRAVARIGEADSSRLWPLLLLQASALDSANRWPEAKAALNKALAIAPDEPLVLNFLGYAKLERGEDLDTAEALIRKASELAPDNASITDSLGWALYKRGRIDEAIEVLQKAAIGDPAQAEIQEHLGDALYSAGRHFEARHAWTAALATADEEETERLKRKLDIGLTQETAAP